MTHMPPPNFDPRLIPPQQMGGFTVRSEPQPRNLTITTKHGAIVICCETGRVSLPEGMPADVAASQFWKHLGPAHGSILNGMIEDRARELFKMRWAEALKTRFPKLLQEEIDRAVAEATRSLLEMFKNPR